MIFLGGFFLFHICCEFVAASPKRCKPNSLFSVCTNVCDKYDDYERNTNAAEKKTLKSQCNNNDMFEVRTLHCSAHAHNAMCAKEERS